MVWRVLLLLVLPVMAQAQGTATLVADAVTVAGGPRLEARGNVEVYYDGTTLSAAAITYDSATDRLSITGPILIRSADGIIITAERADIEPTLENGVLRGARLVLDQQLQLAANSIDRIDGRYSALTRAAVTSCAVCGTGAPLWEIRADQVIHDEEARQLYFENASFRIRGVPVLWVPRMRLPDPTLARATGLLIPAVRTTDLLGIGLKLPYFITLGASRDLTVTPYLSPNTRTLEFRYRQAFLNGTLEINAAATRDDILGDPRGYLFAQTALTLPRGFQLRFDIQTVSDPAYLLDYGYADLDRLESVLGLTRVRDFDLLALNLTYYDSLRDNDPDSQLPPIVVEAAYERRIAAPGLGGTLTYGTSLDAFERTVDTATEGETRDMARLGATLGWQREFILPAGVLLDATAQIGLDYYVIGSDPDATGGLRSAAAADLALRWPLVRRGPGVTHIVEPVVALGWSGAGGVTPPNEDSLLAEFDEGNLFALSRFPGNDAREDGLRGAVALNYARVAPGGVGAAFTVGRLFQGGIQNGFSPASGLAAQNSDWLIAGHLDLPGGIGLDARALFDDSFSFGKTEGRASWHSDTVDLSAAYHYLTADPLRARATTAEEWTVDAAWQVNDSWRVDLGGRYDVARGAPAEALVGFGWRNECVTVDLSVSRRYTFNEAVDPSTDVGFSVGLEGFSAGRTDGVAATQCRD